MTDTRRPAPTERPVVLTIAGSDSGGGAGIQADLKTIEATGGFGTSAVTAVTAQNTTGVESSHVLPVEELTAQLDAVVSDFDVRAAKTGMLATTEVVETVAGYAADFEVPLVVDPVMVAATGDRLLTAEAEDAYESLIAEATLVTPNADEAAVLTDIEVQNEAGARLAGQRLLSMGADAALVKGGHVPGEEVVDVLVTPDTIEAARHPRIDTDATHGSGCTLSAAVATRLALGEPLVDAVGHSVDFMARAVRYHHDVGAGAGAVHHLVDLRDDAAREATAERVRDIVAWFVDENVRPLAPDAGMAVVGATPYAESPADVAAVDGRIAWRADQGAPTGAVRFGGADPLSAFLLGARERHPRLRFAVECRFDDAVAAALSALGWPIVEYDHEGGPGGADATRQAAIDALAGTDEPPAAVLVENAAGRKSITRLLAADGRTVAERVVALRNRLDTDAGRE